VPLATTQKLNGLDLSPTDIGGSDGTLTFSGSNNSTVVVKSTKESDGSYYVTSVTIS
jgi:hypothetical protein